MSWERYVAILSVDIETRLMKHHKEGCTLAIIASFLSFTDRRRKEQGQRITLLAAHVAHHSIVVIIIVFVKHDTWSILITKPQSFPSAFKCRNDLELIARGHPTDAQITQIAQRKHKMWGQFIQASRFPNA